jgi:glycosyltransferase involved in cell wall biosynthesis
MTVTGMNVIAIIAAYNEADIIEPVIAHLVAEGVSVYLIDDGSVDDTRSVAARFLGRGLLQIEQFPSPSDPIGNDLFRWRALLRRKEELASELSADWFIHHDADEFRESPWAGVRLAEAIFQVDAAGYNAIDFEVLNFRPTDDTFVAGADPRPTMRMYEPGAAWDKLQIKCWKKTPAMVDLTSSGGHDVQFGNRNVFPVRFLLRHYPIRSQSHGARKVFDERQARMDPAERAMGWHVHYDHIDPMHDFVIDPSRLIRYDADAVRLRLQCRHRDMEAAERERDEWRERVATSESGRRQLTADRDALRHALDSAAQRLDELVRAADQMQATITAVQRENAQLRQDLAWKEEALSTAVEKTGFLEQQLTLARRRIDDLVRSGSWRITAPLRLALTSLMKLRGLVGPARQEAKD